jgi:hypothetical protein
LVHPELLAVATKWVGELTVDLFAGEVTVTTGVVAKADAARHKTELRPR